MIGDDQVRKTEYEIGGKQRITIALVTDLHEHNPVPVIDILRNVNPDVIAVAGDTLERHEYGENLDRGDRSSISRLICRGIHIADRLSGARQIQDRDVKAEYGYRFLKEAGKIAPVVMSIGNHEMHLTAKD